MMLSSHKPCFKKKNSTRTQWFRYASFSCSGQVFIFVEIFQDIKMDEFGKLGSILSDSGVKYAYVYSGLAFIGSNSSL
jgi:hypothetical protein